MSNNNSLSPPDLDDRIAILQDNIRQLVERSGGQTEKRNSERMTQQSEELDRLTKDRDAMLKK